MVEIVKDYASKRLELLKLTATEKGVETAGTVTNGVLMAVFGIFFLILLNIGVAFLIGEALDNYGYGFLIVAGFYLLLLVLVLVFGKKIKNLIATKILKSL